MKFSLADGFELHRVRNRRWLFVWISLIVFPVLLVWHKARFINNIHRHGTHAVIAANLDSRSQGQRASLVEMFAVNSLLSNIARE